MGVKTAPSYHDFWSSYAELRCHYISTLMGVNRFSWLLANFHLNDNVLIPERNDPSLDKLYKIRPLIEKLRNNFQKHYSPRKEQAVDELMVKFKTVLLRNCEGEQKASANSEVREREEKRGDSDFAISSDGISCVRWKDKRTVTLLSTIHSPVSISQVERKENTG
ncbi:UNVERIFIED_CONTAM: hypothetical protein FKN15_039459 [Acipenser sinensis]